MRDNHGIPYIIYISLNTCTSREIGFENFKSQPTK